MDFQKLLRRMPVTLCIIALNLLVYGLQQVIPGYRVFYESAFNPLYVEQTGQWWRMLTSGFIHDPDNVGHLLMNMLTLFLFGQVIEPLMRRWQYVLLYLASILGGSAMIWAVASLTGRLDVTTIGASGGVFGLFGAYFALARLTQQNTAPILILVVVNFLYGFVVGNVSWEAHLGGLLTGAVLAFVFASFSGRRRRTARWDAGGQPGE